MATIEIRDILDNETGKTIFPRTHVDAIIGLKDFSFFEAVQDTQDPTKFSVKLKSEYTGLWAEGFIAAGGVGQGGGGGGAFYLDGLEDVTAPDPNDGDLLVYNGLVGEWQNKSGLSDYGASLSLTTVSTASYLKDSDGNYLLDSNGNRLAVGESSSVTRLNLLNRSGIVLSSVELDMDLSSYATRSWVTQNFQPTISDLATIRENASDGAAKVSNVQSDWDANSGLAVILNKPDLSVYALQSSLDLVSGRVTALEDLFEIVDGNVHVKNGRALYSDSWIASGGIGSGGGGGVSSLYDLVEVESNTSPSLNDVFYFNGTKWTNSQLKTVNNTSILGSGNISISGGTEVEVYNLLSTGTRVATIRIGGTSGTAYDILAPTSGGGGASSLNDLSDVTTSSVANGDLLVYNTSNSQWENVAKATALTDYALKTGSFTYNFQANSIIFNGGTLTGTTTMQLAHRLVYSYQEGGMSVDDPVVTVSKTIAFLDDIPAHQTVTLTGGTNSGTLKLTTAAGTVDNIAVTGLQALAYKSSLAASDIPDISGTYVTISGTQTITGSKTFSADIITGSDIVPSADIGSSLGYSNRRFSNGNIQTIGTSTLNLKNSSSGNSGMLSANGGYLVVRAGSDVTTTGSFKQLVLHETYGFYPDTTGVNLGYSGASNRWATIYGVDMDLTGNVTMASNKHIDLGPVRLEFANGSLHVTTNDSTNYPSIGFYADGFVASGGVGTSGGGSVSGDYVSYGEAQSLTSAQKLQARTNIGVPTIVLLDDESELPVSPDSDTIYLIKEATT